MARIRPKTKLRLLQTGGLVTTFAPLCIGVGVNWEAYFATTAAGFGLTMGGALAVAIAVINMLGKGKALFGSGFVVTGVIFALCILLEPLILNLKFLTGMMFLGEAGNTVLFKPAVTNAKKQLDYSEQAGVLKEALSGTRG